MRTKQRRAVFELLEHRRLLASGITLVRSFDTWDGGIIRSTDVAGLTFHGPSGHLYLADSEINEIPEIFNGDNIFEVSLRGDAVFREIASNNREPTGITYNALDGFFYVTNDDLDNVTRYDGNLNAPLGTVDTREAVGGPADPEGITSDPATGFLYVADGISGGRQVLAYDANLAFQYGFSVGAEAQDPEGIAFHPTLRHLFIVSGADKQVFEYALNGTFVAAYDLSGFSPAPYAPQGLTFAPTSDPNDDPGALALYIADAGVDNAADGRIYEATISGGQPAQNTAPLVEAGEDRTLVVADFATAGAWLDGAVADDGLPSVPGVVSTAWSTSSGPASATFSDPAAVDTMVSFPVAGRYVLRLTADDGQLTSSDEETLVVEQGVEVRVSAGSDDAEERATGKMLLRSGDLELVFDGGGNQTVGMRFGGVEIPPGATIDRAYIQFQVDEPNTVSTSLTIQAEAVDDAATFTTARGDLSSRSRTTASVGWSPGSWTTRGESGLEQRTPDLSVVIEEVVGRPGWSSGNSLVMIITGTGERTAESYDGNPTAAPLLHVEFTTGTSSSASSALESAFALAASTLLPSNEPLDSVIEEPAAGVPMNGNTGNTSALTGASVLVSASVGHPSGTAGVKAANAAYSGPHDDAEEAISSVGAKWNRHADSLWGYEHDFWQALGIPGTRAYNSGLAAPPVGKRGLTSGSLEWRVDRRGARASEGSHVLDVKAIDELFRLFGDAEQ